MTDLPEPLISADIDLTDFAFMPIEVRRLLTSETWMTATGDEKAAAMTLWLESWHQMPCGSLPDNDRMLSLLSQAGAKWGKVKRIALRGWVKCADGRLYHRVVCEKAKESWDKKTAYRDRTSAARAAREAKRSAPQNQSSRETDQTTQTVTDTATSPVTDNATDNIQRSVTVHKGEVSVSVSVREKEREEAKLADSYSQAARPRQMNPLDWIKPDPETGRGTVGGYYLDVVFEKCLDLAYMETDRSRFPQEQVIVWLHDGIEPDTIYAAIRRCASRNGYRFPDKLSWFDKAVREQRAAA